MARKTLVVLVTAAAAAGIIATGAAAGAALTGDGSGDGVGVAVSSSPSDDVTTPSDDNTPGDDVTPSDDNTPGEGVTPSDDGSTPPSHPTPADVVSRDKAIDIALAKTGGGTVVETEREFEHGRPAWKIEIVKGGVEHKVYVDRETGGIVKFDSDDDGGHHGDDNHGDDHGGNRGGDDHSGKGRGGHDDY